MGFTEFGSALVGFGGATFFEQGSDLWYFPGLDCCVTVEVSTRMGETEKGHYLIPVGQFQSAYKFEVFPSGARIVTSEVEVMESEYFSCDESCAQTQNSEDISARKEVHNGDQRAQNDGGKEKKQGTSREGVTKEGARTEDGAGTRLRAIRQGMDRTGRLVRGTVRDMFNGPK